MRSRIIQVFATLLVITVHASAQLGQVSGKVLADGEPVPFATIVLYNSTDSTMAKANTTDDDGVFHIQGVPAGQYFLEASYVGYAKFTTEVFELAGKDSRSLGEIALEIASEELDEVVIVSARPIVEVHPDKTVFNVEGSINASGNTALELLRKSPGVVVDNNDNVTLSGKSGVQIYVDGKPLPFGADDLGNYLKSLQSSEIDAIEIITNPSARYDAQGNAGIINIRLKKDKSLGTNGSINLGYRYGELAKYNANGSFNYRNKDMNVFGGYGIYSGDNVNEFALNRQLNGIEYDQQNDMLNSYMSHNFRLGTDFFISKRSTIGFLVNGNLSDNENDGKSVTDIGPIGSVPESVLTADNERTSDRNNWNFNINYIFRGEDESSWNIDLDHGRYRNDTETYQPNIYSDYNTGQITDERIFTTDQMTDIDVYTFKVDHERNWLGGRFGTGVKLALVNTDNTFDFYDLIDDSPVLNIDRSNNFAYEENVNAGYLSYQRQLKEKWNLMLGLRVEHTHSTGTLTSQKPEDNDIVDRNYVDFFPSGGLTYQVHPKHSLRLNYSRRIDRPSYQDLNPFEFKLDELSFQKGNAFLKPQYSNSISLTHTFNYRLNTSLSYTRTDDVFTQITEALDDTTSILTYVNLARQTNLALTVSYPFEVNKWWNVYTNVTGYRLHNTATIDGEDIDLAANVLSFYAQNTFLLPHGIKLELSGWYNSPSIWQGNWTNKAMGSMDIGVQKSLFKEAANLKVSVSDVLNTQRWGGESEFGPLKMSGGGQWESQQIRINFTYYFGNRQVKGARQRKTGMEAEQGRIKSE